ncbi:hypothetical protein NCCP2716_25640 [Sporosarcina sp. NCCP-2716]|uniref:peptide-methionine (S)-S-oxide reductase MsrA n=1 Tax=Sporosarcina sp. NCCP-2716 TaxID=2943679 RepID=UPI00203C556A|nr:peptide-methionine (S)-S-oxide reductase MsrA [Sporosarcina sp. NCCP-2716]GKV70066.1 hypothetical protein NCCP2716_25640 [Sporosarcina sp. NCCP-2716]
MSKESKGREVRAMKRTPLIWLLLGIVLLAACGKEAGRPAAEPEPADGYQLKQEVKNINEHLDYSGSDLHKIYFAGGCFWGVEAYFARLYGVEKTVSGYANGTGADPSYEDVIQGDRKFAETVEVTYDPERIPLESLVDHLFQVIDPTTENQQGNDRGIQYRSGIYYTDKSEAEIVEKAVADEAQFYKKDIVTEALPLENFYPAEEFHQDYLEKNPDGYCHINLHTLDGMTVEPIAKDEEIVKQLSEPKQDTK